MNDAQQIIVNQYYAVLNEMINHLAEQGHCNMDVNFTIGTIHIETK